MKKNKIYLSNFNSDNSETVAYNNPLFPAYIHHGRTSTFPDYSFITHWHQDLEFVVIFEGSMTYSVNGILTELHEGQAFMVNSRQVHSCFSKEKKECKFICILFSLELFQNNAWFYEKYIEPITYCSDIPFLKFENTGWQRTIIFELSKLNENSTPFEIMEHAYFIMDMLYHNISFSPQTTYKQSADMLSLKRMLLFLENNYTSQINLSDIAASGNCCQSKCCYIFKTYLHDTPITYLTKFRLQKSLNTLLNNDLSITDIAFSTGFNSSSYYCELFHKYYDQSPLQYKKEKITDKLAQKNCR